MLERLMALDRRIIFLALLIVVIIPTLLKVAASVVSDFAPLLCQGH